MSKLPPKPASAPASADDDGWTLVGAHHPAGFGTVAVPRLLITVEREAGKAVARAVELEGERIRVGSHQSNELVLTDRSVSRFHCVLSLSRGAWNLMDTDSLNGTMLSGVRIRDA